LWRRGITYGTAATAAAVAIAAAAAAAAAVSHEFMEEWELRKQGQIQFRLQPGGHSSAQFPARSRPFTSAVTETSQFADTANK